MSPPARASEHGNVIGLVSVYIYIYIYNIYMYKKNCNLANKVSNLPQVVAMDFFLKIKNPTAGRNSGDSA